MTRSTPSIPFSVWRKMAMASWRPRKDPTISATMNIEASEMLRYIDDVKAATGQHVTPMHLVGRAAGKMLEALPGLNGRVVFGSFLPSPTIDCFFVVSLRTDPVTGIQAASTDLSGAVVRRVDEKPPWLIAKELADRASKIRHDEDPEFKRTNAMVKGIPPLLLRPVLDAMGFITEACSCRCRSWDWRPARTGRFSSATSEPTVSTQPSLPCRPSSTCRSRS